MSRDIVTIKSSRHGFEIVLSQEASVEELSDELGRKFSQNREFFGNARKAVTFSGKRLSTETENLLLDAIRDNSDVDISCVIVNDEERDEMYLRAMNEFAMVARAAKSQVYIGTVRSGEIIESAYGITILGDVNPGAKVISGGCVVILGTLYGKVSAGEVPGGFFDMEIVPDEVEGDAHQSVSPRGRGALTGSDRPESVSRAGEEEVSASEEVFVAALEMKPQSIRINSVAAEIDSRSLRVPLLSKNAAKIAYERDGEVYIDSINGDFLSRL